jgi:hypothetical protein
MKRRWFNSPAATRTCLLVAEVLLVLVIVGLLVLIWLPTMIGPRLGTGAK